MRMILHKFVIGTALLRMSAWYLDRAFDEPPVDILSAFCGISLALYLILFVLRAQVDLK